MEDQTKRSLPRPTSGIPRASRLPMPPSKVPTATQSGLRPTAVRDAPQTTPSSTSTDAPAKSLRPMASSSRISSGGRLARPSTQAFGTNGLPVTLAPPLGMSAGTSAGTSMSPTTSPITSSFGSRSRGGLRRPPSYQHLGRLEPRGRSRPSALPDQDVAESPVEEASAPSSAVDRAIDVDDMLFPRPLALSGRHEPTSESPERRPAPPRLTTALAPAATLNDSAISPADSSMPDSAISPADDDDDDYFPQLLSPATDRSRSSLSLQDRVIESLQSVALSPSRSRSTFFGGPGSASQSRPGSRDSRPGSKDGPPAWGSMHSGSRPVSRQSALGRPGSSGGPQDRGAGPTLRTASGTLRRPLSTINDSPSQPLVSTRSLNTPAKATSLKTPTKPSLPRPTAPATTSRLPSLRSLEPNAAGGATDKKAGYATIGPKSLKVRPSAPALRRRASANLLEKPQPKLEISTRQSVESSISSPSWDGTIASKASSATSGASVGRATPDIDGPSSKSSSALRDHIAKLRASKRGVKSAANPSKGEDALASPQSSMADATSPLIMASAVENDTLAPWSHSDPFNLSQDGVDGGQKKVLQKRINTGRTSGRLNIAALGLKEIPAEVMNMYDLASIGAHDASWAESVDLTRFVAADNEFETIDNSVFPDQTAEEIMDDEESNGNIFAGLEALDLHGNLLISVPTGLRQLRLLTSLNLTHNKLSNDAVDAITQITTLRTLSLGSNLLHGPLSPAFANLENLEVLDLHANAITALPTDIDKMTHLRILNVCENSLQSLPLEQLAKLPLTELQARKNKLAGVLISQGVEAMPNLQLLDLTSNQLTHLTAPGTTVGFPLLHQLSVSMNRLRELPDVSGWQNLATLAANDNTIADFPIGFPSLQKLRNCDLANNDVRIVPLEVGHMKDLTMLRIAGNPLRDKKFLSAATDDVKEILLSRIEPESEPEPVSSQPDVHGRPVTPEKTDTAADHPAYDDSLSDLDDFATPPTSAPASPTRPRASTMKQTWSVKPGGILDRSSTESVMLDPVICAKVSSEHRIQQIMLHNNSFTAVPDCLMFFSDTLTSLSLSDNKLDAGSYLTEPLELPALRELNLSRNRIESLAPLLSYLSAPRLEKLDVSANRLQSLPLSMRQVFSELTNLHAADNRMVELDPQSIKGMRIVDVSRNEIQRLNPHLGLLAAGGPGEGTLEKLEVQGNRFRVPQWTILEMGTTATLRWLRGRIPLAEMAEIPGWRDEGSNDEDGEY